MKTFLKRSLLVLAGCFVLIQFVPVNRENPSVEADLVAPPEVKAVLKRSCYDCHSNESTWPWYSKVAPVSWLVAHDVEEGREHLNFSDWSRLDRAKMAHMAEEIREEYTSGEMPYWPYLIVHRDAELSAADKAVLDSYFKGIEGEENR